jgi:cytochrome b6-f complex iron-sulfur subunit
MAKKKTTAEILADARAKDGGGQPAPSAADAVPDSEAAPAAEASAESEPTEVSAKPAAKPSAGKPKSTSDILARLRAEKGGSKPAAPEKKAAGKSPAPKKAAVATSPAATGEKQSPLDMLKAMREAKQAEAATAESAAEAPAGPKKPVRGNPAAKRKSAAKSEVPRRGFLVACLMAPLVLFSSPFAVAWTFFSTATAAFSLAVARFMMPNVLIEPPSRFKVGSPSDYPGGTVSTKWKAEFGVWIVNTEYEGKSLIYALFSICTHLGCTPNWLEGEQKFKCPCHGSGFYIDGVNFEGPAPRPLERTAIRIAPDGMLEVDKSQKFQQELGQWEDAKSFIELA